MPEGAQRVFTDPYIKSLKPKAAPYKRAEYAPKGEGRLVVRVLPSGVKEFFYRYRINGDDKTLALGRYDALGRIGKTLAQVRTTLHEKRALQRSTGDVKEHEKAEERKKEVEARRGSLQQLCAAYVESLRAAGKPSATEAEGIFRRHVIKPFPMLAATKANEIEPGDIQRILARMVKAGIRRQVNATRSYLGAAFAFGGRADHDPRTVAGSGVLFALKANPVSLVPVIREYERTGERTLAEDELREYWKTLEALPIVQRATLRFNFALACQRLTQLLRADWPVFDFEQNTLLLRDSKGRGGARDHLLPLTPFALEQLKPLRKINAAADSPFTADGRRRMVVGTLSSAVGGVAKTLKKSKKIEPFQLRDLRRTAETTLQRLGIDKEVRAHLLSHGRTRGVQGKHYERYDFLREKRAALEKWARHLERIISGKLATVTSLRASK
jgi:integrase